MLRYIGPIILIIVTLALFATEATAEPPATPVKSSVTPICHEDDPCWHWPTMGNLMRGVVLNSTPRRRAVLSPCEFALYSAMRWIDWRRTPRLHGDRFARRYGCHPRPIIPTES